MKKAVLCALGSCLALTSLVGCGGDPNVTLRVLADSSLTESFTELGRQFEKDHPGSKVEITFGPSADLAEQVDGGPAADVFAAASASDMDALVEADHAEKPEDFAKNRLEIAVPADNPGNVQALADLTEPKLKVAVCEVQVPCGKLTADLFAGAQLTVDAATRETDAQAVVTKVSLGEVDAGVVFTTDVRAAGDDVHNVEIPDEQNVSAAYPIATLTHSEHAEAAREFVDFVRSDAGAKILVAAGLQIP